MMLYLIIAFICLPKLIVCYCIKKSYPTVSLISHVSKDKHSNLLGMSIYNDLALRSRIFCHLGDYKPQSIDDYDEKQKQDFNLNVGRALETLRRQLPMVFWTQELDFSIFSPQVTVSDGSGNRLALQRTMYAGIVKSVSLASAFSFIQPSMNVGKIEYVEDCTTIQCRVHIVLPDSIRIDGQAIWEGMFYFSLDHDGLIQAHTFDKKVSTMRPNGLSTSAYPWLRAAPTWSSAMTRDNAFYKFEPQTYSFQQEMEESLSE